MRSKKIKRGGASNNSMWRYRERASSYENSDNNESRPMNTTANGSKRKIINTVSVFGEPSFTRCQLHGRDCAIGSLLSIGLINETQYDDLARKYPTGVPRNQYAQELTRILKSDVSEIDSYNPNADKKIFNIMPLKRHFSRDAEQERAQLVTIWTKDKGGHTFLMSANKSGQLKIIDTQKNSASNIKGGHVWKGDTQVLEYFKKYEEIMNTTIDRIIIYGGETLFEDMAVDYISRLNLGNPSPGGGASARSNPKLWSGKGGSRKIKKSNYKKNRKSNYKKNRKSNYKKNRKSNYKKNRKSNYKKNRKY